MPPAKGQAKPLAPEKFRNLVENALPQHSLELTGAHRERLARFLAELDLWRRHVNLTGRLTAEELVSHALESLVGAELLAPRSTVVDVGTGGGFPGVPLAIARADVELTWLEPREKRAAFLRHVARALPVANAVVRTARTGDLEPSEFDFATCRAVALDALGAVPFLRPGGRLLLWTTRSKAVAATGSLELERVLPLPQSRQRIVAVYRHG
jgi:16S rRNA (guanine527-N7)-methyltransferase